MTKTMFGCANCGALYAGKSDAACPECGCRLTAFNVTESAWDALSEEEKKTLKEKILSAEKERRKNRDLTLVLENRIDQMSKDLKTIRNILVYGLIVSGAVFVIMFIAMLASSGR